MNNLRILNRTLAVMLVTVAVVAGLAAVPGAQSGAAAPPAWDRAPNLGEFSLLALANRERAATGVPPLVWNDDLGKAARFHSHDMVDNDCYQHSSCDGTAWNTRIRRYYGSYSALGENITLNGSPRRMHDDWMDSSGHRSNILGSSYREFGAGIAVGETNFGNWWRGTEDFGSRGGTVTIPPIPAGAVLAPADYSPTTWTWELLVNHYSATSADRAVSARAMVDGAPIALALRHGTAINGTWSGELRTPRFPTDCKRVYFEVTRASGATFRWPSSGDIGVGWTCFDALLPVPGFATGGTTTTTTTTVATTTTTRPAVGAPTVVIQSPQAGVVSGMVSIRASATDDGTVKTIEVYVDGKRLVRKQGGSAVRSWNSNSASVKPGPHTITVKAYDEQGNVGTSSVVVTK